MLRSFRLIARTLSVGCMLAGGVNPANANLSEDDIFSIKFNSLHLGMKRSEFERLIRLQRNISEPDIGALDSFDCGYLAQNTTEALAHDIIGLPEEVGFSTIDRSSYSVRFGMRPDEDRVSKLYYRVYRPYGDWSAYLTELESRFDKPDQVGRTREGNIVALWCTDGEVACQIDGRPRRTHLSVTISTSAGQRSAHREVTLAYQLSEGLDASQNRKIGYEALAKADPLRAGKIYRKCRSAKGKFRSHKDAEHHYISLMPMGRKASDFYFKPDRVPTSVFTAIGIDPEVFFAPGVCYTPAPAIERGSECTSSTITSFQWARQVDGLWLLSFRVGGAYLTRKYLAVRAQRGGSFKKIWWSDDLEDFNAWIMDGTKPMI